MRKAVGVKMAEATILAGYCSHPPLSMRDMFQDPQWMPETVDSTKPYIQGEAKIGLQLQVHEHTELFLYYYVLIIVLFSI